jgi:hypothetical protein
LAEEQLNSFYTIEVMYFNLHPDGYVFILSQHMIELLFAAMAAGYYLLKSGYT